MGLSAMLNTIFSQQVEFFQMQQDTEDPMYHLNKISSISLESDIDDWDRESVTVFNIQSAKAALITIENAFLGISHTKISTNKHCFFRMITCGCDSGSFCWKKSGSIPWCPFCQFISSLFLLLGASPRKVILHSCTGNQ